MKKSLIAAMLAVLLLCFAGCKERSASENAVETEDLSAYAGKSVQGRIDAVDDGVITVALGTFDSRMQDMDGDGFMPAMPDGTAPTGGEAPDMPDDANGDGFMPAMPDGDAPAGGMGEFTANGEIITLTVGDNWQIAVSTFGQTTDSDASALAEGALITIDFLDTGAVRAVTITASVGGRDNMPPQGNAPMGGMGSSTGDNGSAAVMLSDGDSIIGGSYASSEADENALRLSSGIAALSGVTVDKEGDTSNTENSDFYGDNAAVLAENGSTLTVTDAVISTNASGANGLFAYGATINVSDTEIMTAKNNSGGVDVTGGGTIDATNLTIVTNGASSAALRSDRGGGTLTATGGTYTTNGTGSPAVYSTADITVNGATFTATNSEALVIEGKNSITLTDCTVSGRMSGTYADDNNENIHGIMLYQSMSGDAEEGISVLTVTGGTLTTHSGDLFYVTNTSCRISLTAVTLNLFNDVLLRVAGNDSARGWGTTGANGGDCTLDANNQTLSGIVYVDEISKLTFSLAQNSVFTGCINPDGTDGTVSVTMDGTPTWMLTANSYLTSFTGDASRIVTNGYHVYVNGTLLI